MGTAENFTPSELHEILQKLWTGLGAAPPSSPEPQAQLIHLMDVAGTSSAADKDSYVKAIRLAIAELARLEDKLPDELRKFRAAVQEYCTHLEKGCELENRLRTTTETALPVLDKWIEERARSSADSIENTPQFAAAWNDETLQSLPRIMLRSLDYFQSALFRSRTLLQHLTLLDMRERINVNSAPFQSQFAKALHKNGEGLSIADITDIMIPNTKPDTRVKVKNKTTQRAKAKNKTRQRVKAKSTNTAAFTSADNPASIERFEKEAALWLRGEPLRPSGGGVKRPRRPFHS